MELWQQSCLGWNLSSIDGHRVTLGKLLPTVCPPASAGFASGCPICGCSSPMQKMVYSSHLTYACPPTYLKELFYFYLCVCVCTSVCT